MVEETGTTWYLMLQILNLPPQANKHAWMRKWPPPTTPPPPLTHTHKHTQKHQGVKKEQFATQARLSFTRDISFTYHDSVLRHHTKILVQWTSKYINCFLKLSYVPARFNGNADLLTFTKLAILARGHP